MKNWRRWGVLAAAIVLAAGGIYLGYTWWMAGPTLPDAPESHIVAVRRGPLVATVKAVGAAAAPAEVALNFGTGGRLTELHVAEGDTVQAGDVLARVDATDLELQMAQAEAALALSQAQLARTQAGPTEADIASAEASLAAAQANLAQLAAGPLAADLAAAQAALRSAQTSYQELLAGPSSDQMTAARTSLEKAQVALQAAQAEYDKYAWQQGYEASPQAAALQQATLDYEQALANYNLAAASATAEELDRARAQVAQAQAQLERESAGPTGAEVEAAEAQVARAQAELARLRNSPTAEELAVARAQVRQTELVLEQARRQLDNTTLVAPVSGVVASVGANVGELVSMATPVVSLVDLSSLFIAIGVNEVDIGRVAVGQKVLVRLDAFPSQQLTGRIAEIAPVSTVTAGVVNYPVRVELSGAGVTLRPGMDAEVQIVTAEKADALLVPRSSLRLRDGQWLVWVLRQGSVTGVQVEVGDRMGELVEVTGSLSEGDNVAVGANSPDAVRRGNGVMSEGLARRAD